MNWIRDYAIPTLIVAVASLLVCAGLWFIYTSSSSTVQVDDVFATDTGFVEAEEHDELELPDLGILTLVLLFLGGSLQVALLMGIPGFITVSVLRLFAARQTTIVPS